MGRHRNFKKKDVLDAIDGSYGIVSTVAAKLHCNWHTADEYIKKWPETLQALSDEEESKLDFVEGKAIKKINEGDGAMIRFYLATKGKKRGFTYDEKLEADETAEDKELNIITDDAATGGGEITEADE
nr:MAG TPA: putative terminase small subunit [Caudoviricetes sp.]